MTGKILPTGIFYFGVNLEKFKPDIPTEEAVSFHKNSNIHLNGKVILSIRRLVRMLDHYHILLTFATVVSQTKEDLVLNFA